MYFGLCNGLASFQCFMNNVFTDMLDFCVIMYLDDILIFMDDPHKHSDQVHEVLRRLRLHKLYAKPEKCEFHMATTDLLGYVVTPNGISMDKVKTKAIQDWPEPRKVHDIQSFLGFANFYRHFIHNYSDIVVPLTQLTQKNIKWEFDESCRKSFNNLKAAFTTAPCLIHWKPDQQVILETDASDYAIAGTLSHQLEDSSVHPIVFHSQTLSPTELNYNTYNKELLTVYESFKVWCHYLKGCSHSIEVLTDHKNLEYFATTRMLSYYQVHWSEYLAPFNMIL